MATEPAKRGRYAEAARNDQLLLDAARAVFLTQGFDAPVAAVAARAGVGIGSLYRRYATKEALLQRLCLVAMEHAIESAERARRNPDAGAALVGYIAECVDYGNGALAPLAGTIDTTPEMWATADRALRLESQLVERAKRARALHKDVTLLDVALLIEQFSRGSVIDPTDEERNARQRLLAISLRGLGLHDGSLPGHKPSMKRYHERWARDS